MLNSKIVKKTTEDKGDGLFANKLIPEGEIVWQLDDNCEILPLVQETLEQHPNAYQFGNNYVICNDDGDYMNHSCDPNCWWEDDKTLVAKRDISIGEEITYDYSTCDIYTDWVSSWEPVWD